MEMDEREMHNLLDSKTGDPKPSSPLDLSQDGMAESTALTQCDEVPDTSEPDDDFVEVDQRVKEMVGDGKASLPSSSKEDPSTALTKVPNLSQGKEKEGEGKISSPSSSTEDPSTAPSKVLTHGENSGTSQSVTLAQVTDLLHAHVAETKHRFRNHSLRLAALEDPSPGVDAGTQTPTVPWRLKRRLTSESKANVSKHHERKEAGLARKGSLPSNLAKMGFVSYKKLKALVKKDTALEVLAQLGYPLESFSSLDTHSSLTFTLSSGSSCGPMAASVGSTPTWMKSSSPLIPLLSKQTICFPGPALQSTNGLQTNQQPAGRNFTIRARKSSSMTICGWLPPRTVNQLQKRRGRRSHPPQSRVVRELNHPRRAVPPHPHL